MATIGEIAVADPASSSNPQVEVITVPNTGSNPGVNHAGRQVCALGDGGGNSNYQTVDSDGVARTIVGRSGTATISTKASSATEITILAANTLRINAIINNQSSATLYLSTSSSVTAGPTGTSVLAVIPGGTTWSLLREWGAVYTGNLYGIWDSADGANAVISEFTS